MKHVIFIVTMMVAGITVGVCFMHEREKQREAAAEAPVVVADAAAVRPPIIAADPLVPPPIEVAAVPDAAPVDATVAEVRSDDCDEVSCVLDDYGRPCCARYRRPTNPVADASPQSLDRKMIVDGVNSVKPRIVACAAPDVHGTVKVRVRVAPSGAVASATIAATPDARLGACVHDVMTSILFRPTQNGGSFSYPFVF
jgi:hypothetical protein